MLTKYHASVLALVILMLCAPASGQGVAGPAGSRDVGTLPPEASEFDFWIGTWQVGVGGVDKVKRFGKGVAILETFTGAGAGSSVNVFDATTGMWTETWLATNGNYFQVTGRKQGDDIVLVGDFRDPRDGATKLLRLSFVNITRNSFAQRYETSTDGGQTWTLLSVVPFTRTKR